MMQFLNDLTMCLKEIVYDAEKGKMIFLFRKV